MFLSVRSRGTSDESRSVVGENGGMNLTADPYCGDLILAALAIPYVDHPDYQQEWSPSLMAR